MDGINNKLTKLLIDKYIDGCQFLYSCESQSNALDKMLDTKKSIDGFLIDSSGSLESYAVRHQYNVNYKSFTTRLKLANGSTDTEYKKIKNAIDNHLLKPTYIIQAYWSNPKGEKLLSYKIIKTKELFDYYDKNFNNCYINKAPDGNEFIIAKWDKLEKENQLNIFA